MKDEDEANLTRHFCYKAQFEYAGRLNLVKPEIVISQPRIEILMAALFYSPVDFTDASDLHQTVVKFIG